VGLVPEVRCTVSNCTYWYEGNRCSAETILVISDAAIARMGQPGARLHGGGKHDQEIGEIGQTPARVSTETCCYTFRPRDAAQAQKDTPQAQQSHTGQQNPR